jgi:hypothetical protein
LGRDRPHGGEGRKHRAHAAQGALKITVDMKMAQKKLRHFLRRPEREKGFFYNFNVEHEGPPTGGPSRWMGWAADD